MTEEIKQSEQPQSNASKMPTDVPSLQELVRSLVARLMAHDQTNQELLRANIHLKGSLNLAEANKMQLENYIKSLLEAKAQPTEEKKPEEPAATAPVEGADNANTVQA